MSVERARLQPHMVPMMIEKSELYAAASTVLLDKFAIYMQPIDYPTLPSRTEGLRITPGRLYPDTMIDDLAAALSPPLRHRSIVVA